MVPSDPHVYEYGRDDEIVRCPWHGYEFEIASGRAIVDGSRMRVKTYDVALEGNDVVVYI
jgi:nitrite reductase/ring-hydroxylating ferredoxin subunit